MLALKRKLKLQNVLLLFGTVFLLLTIRNTREYGHIVVDEWKGFSTTPSTEAHFPVVDDLYPFMHGVRETLELDTREKKECRMYMQCIQEWPFCAHSTSLFLQPCEREPSITGNYQYLLFYKVPVPPAFSNAKVMFQMNGNTLLQK
ncbi:MAG: hypothetical protein LBG59_07245 [Candidatus Peribacteria bacterium]|nr:hypothetical protein [Candidatus Peribacteria bacterium]